MMMCVNAARRQQGRSGQQGDIRRRSVDRRDVKKGKFTSQDSMKYSNQ